MQQVAHVCGFNCIRFKSVLFLLYCKIAISRAVQNESDAKKEAKSEDGDIVQKSMGTFGVWHIWVCALIFLVKFPVAWHQLSTIFVAPPPKFMCVDNTTDKCSPDCPSHEFDRSVFTETIITQWDLVCGKSALATLSQTITMLGILVGNMIFGYLSDRFGRRDPLVWAVIIQAICGIAAAFSPWFYLFLLLRFVLAAATGGTMITSFVLVMELVGLKWRTTLGILYQIPFNMGHLSLPLFSYFLRDWRYFHVALSLPSLLLISYYWLLPESPRYLLTAGRKEEAVKVMTKAAVRNKLPTSNIKGAVDNYLQEKSNLGDKTNSKQGGNIMDLIKTPHMRINTVCICFNWFVCGLCFYGVAQFIGQLGGNIFLNVTFSAIIQIPSTLFSVWCVKSWGRRYSLLFGDILGGLSLLLISVTPVSPTWIHSVISTTGMFGLAVAFPTVYIFAGELFPTVVRNVGVGTCSMAARIGSMIAPFIADLSKVEPWLPPLIFGVIPLIGAVLCYKLPETLDCKLPDTIEESEEFCENLKLMNNKKIDSTEMVS